MCIYLLYHAFVLLYGMWKKQQKWYVVWKWFAPGVYDTRDACKESINGYAWAVYKSYGIADIAHAVYDQWKGAERAIRLRYLLDHDYIHQKSICTDAACSWNPWQLEWRWVDTVSWKQLFGSWVYEAGTVNIGEYIALLTWMKWLIDRGLSDRYIYTDSIVAMSRFRNKQVKTDLYTIEKNKPLRHVLDQRHAWRMDVDPPISVLKRNTKVRGEIFADFGRK